MVVLFVQGKGKSRKLVAPKSVGGYLDRIRAITKVTEPEHPHKRGRSILPRRPAWRAFRAPGLTQRVSMSAPSHLRGICARHRWINGDLILMKLRYREAQGVDGLELREYLRLLADLLGI